MKAEYKIFFAIPYDGLMKKAYENICSDLRNIFKKEGCELTCVIGNEQVGPSQKYLDVMAFRLQNAELHRRFFKEIADADIIVADLTNNNPNVHLELGIALALNKNILRVTGRPIKELGFNIQNFEVYGYKNQEDLLRKMQEYLGQFLLIKKLEFSVEYKDLYKKTNEILLPGNTEKIIKQHVLWTSSLINNHAFRDGAVKLRFKFLDNLNPESWAGIYFRAAREFLLESYLLYIRQNGLVELAVYPGTKIIFVQKLGDSNLLNRTIEVEMEFENDELDFSVNGQELKVRNLEKQNKGNVFMATWECRTQFEDIELIERDTCE